MACADYDPCWWEKLLASHRQSGAWDIFVSLAETRERDYLATMFRDDAIIEEARKDLWLEYRAKRMAGDEVSLDGFRAVGQELGLC